MLKWIRQLLRKWLLEEEQKVDTIECLLNGRIGRVAVVDAFGLKLLVSNGQDSYLVSPEQAVNRGDFWKAWSQRSPEEYIWEDGSKFEAEKEGQ